jgi:hypothetical protein
MNITASDLCKQGRMKETDPWYLYLVVNENCNVVKIGVTQKVKARISALQVGNHCVLKMYPLVKYNSKKEVYDAEKLILVSWSEFHVGGEWFKNNACAIDLIKDGNPIISKMRQVYKSNKDVRKFKTKGEKRWKPVR